VEDNRHGGASTRGPIRRAAWLISHETRWRRLGWSTLAVLGLFNERFLTIDQLPNQGRADDQVGLRACAGSSFITGGIDLSLGSISRLDAIMLGYSWKNLGFPLRGDSLRERVGKASPDLSYGLLITRSGWRR